MIYIVQIKRANGEHHEQSTIHELPAVVELFTRDMKPGDRVIVSAYPPADNA